ncbi:hypothetical protein D3C78_1794690 [compost metagenome]
MLTQVFVVFELQSARGAESKGILEELDGLFLIETHQSRQIRITHAQSAAQGGDCGGHGIDLKQTRPDQSTVVAQVMRQLQLRNFQQGAESSEHAVEAEHAQ